MDELITLSKVFSDRNRLFILTLLLREESLCVCEICDTLDLSQPLVSRHLKQMKETGILHSHKHKKWVHYTLTPKPSPFLQSLLYELSPYQEILSPLVVCQMK